MVIPQPRAFSLQDFKILAEKPPKYKEIMYFFMRKSLEMFGPLSDGMNIGLKHGFDSGISLDYVYRNKAHGKFLIGTIIDFFYLRSTGWKGIRHRKAHLKTVLRKTIETLQAHGQQPVILDCAAGCGRYLFETANEMGKPIDIHLRDINPYNLDVAKETADNLNVKTATFSRVDAFDTHSYSGLDFQPNIVIVSGLFELFSNNELLHTTLSGIKNVMQKSGYILYTGQPWHPQLEIIARVLNNHLGRRWIMRTRVQAELDELVQYVGFNKLDTVIDDLGIFTVSIARNE